jgi:hypothetical protein
MSDFTKLSSVIFDSSHSDGDIHTWKLLFVNKHGYNIQLYLRDNTVIKLYSFGG